MTLECQLFKKLMRITGQIAVEGEFFNLQNSHVKHLMGVLLKFLYKNV